MSDADQYLRELSEGGFRDADKARFFAAWERIERAYLERLAMVTAGAGDWRACFRAGARETVRLVEEHRDEARFLVVDALLAGEAGRQRQGAFKARLAEKLDHARLELDEPERVPPSASIWVVAIFFDRIYRRCAAGTGEDLPSQLPELTFLGISVFFGTDAGLQELIREPREGGCA